MADREEWISCLVFFLLFGILLYFEKIRQILGKMRRRSPCFGFPIYAVIRRRRIYYTDYGGPRCDSSVDVGTFYFLAEEAPLFVVEKWGELYIVNYDTGYLIPYSLPKELMTEDSSKSNPNHSTIKPITNTVSSNTLPIKKQKRERRRSRDARKKKHTLDVFQSTTMASAFQEGVTSVLGKETSVDRINNKGCSEQFRFHPVYCQSNSDIRIQDMNKLSHTFVRPCEENYWKKNPCKPGKEREELLGKFKSVSNRDLCFEDNQNILLNTCSLKNLYETNVMPSFPKINGEKVKKPMNSELATKNTQTPGSCSTSKKLLPVYPPMKEPPPKDEPHCKIKNSRKNIEKAKQGCSVEENNIQFKITNYNNVVNFAEGEIWERNISNLTNSEPKYKDSNISLSSDYLINLQNQCNEEDKELITLNEANTKTGCKTYEGSEKDETNGWIEVRKRIPRRRKYSPIKELSRIDGKPCPQPFNTSQPTKYENNRIRRSRSSDKQLRKCEDESFPEMSYSLQRANEGKIGQRPKHSNFNGIGCNVKKSKQSSGFFQLKLPNEVHQDGGINSKFKNALKMSFTEALQSTKKSFEKGNTISKEAGQNSVMSRTAKQQQNSVNGEVSMTEPAPPVASSILNDPKTCQVVSAVETSFTAENGVIINRERCFLYGISLNTFSISEILSVGQTVKYELLNKNSVKECWIGDPTPDAKKCYELVERYCQSNNVLLYTRCQLLDKIDYLPDVCAPVITKGTRPIVSLCFLDIKAK